MMLKQNTSTEILVTLIDCVDGKTLIEELTLGWITAAIYKNSTRSILELTSENFIYIADGIWKLILTAGNTDTVGRLKITLRDDDVFLLINVDYEILPGGVYDSLFAGTALATTEQVIESDSRIDTSNAAQWQLVICKKGDTGTEYARKDMFDINGNSVTSISQIPTALTEPV